MPGASDRNNLRRDTMRRMMSMVSKTAVQRELAALKVAYSEDSKLLTGYVNNLVGVERIYPRHNPIQASGRWSTIDPPITNWPRACVAPECPRDEHEWTEDCWSVRDILLPDEDEVLISWDHDNIEGKIHDLIVNDQAAIETHQQGYDLHTITCCDIFGYPYPTNLRNPHTAPEDEAWRQSIKGGWQGKDTKQRVLAKNFNHGSKYTETWRFVHRIEGIEKYGVSRKDLGQLAARYIASKGAAWQRKLKIMEDIRWAREARTLYGFRRVFFDSSKETGREGFSHMISGTVSDYNNETLLRLHEWLGDNVRLMHNAHDGNKIAVKREVLLHRKSTIFTETLKGMIERSLTYQGRTLVMTAGIKVSL